MYFRNKKELEDLNLKISEGIIDTAGFSRDNASKITSGINSSHKTGKNQSK